MNPPFRLQPNKIPDDINQGYSQDRALRSFLPSARDSNSDFPHLHTFRLSLLLLWFPSRVVRRICGSELCLGRR